MINKPNKSPFAYGPWVSRNNSEPKFLDNCKVINLKQCLPYVRARLNHHHNERRHRHDLVGPRHCKVSAHLYSYSWTVLFDY